MKNYLAIAAILIAPKLFSQNQNDQWVFGASCHISFESGMPINVMTTMDFLCLDNAASVSNPSSGDLLFYSNGFDVYNAEMEVMENGENLLGHNSGGTTAIAVQKPGNSNKYYLFTTDAWAGSNGIRYSEIDMSLNEGLGAVTEIKNELLLSDATEKITIIPHSNNVDYWVLVHPFNSGSYYAYLLNSDGLSETFVESIVGVEHTGGTAGTYNAAGQLAVNEQYNMVAAAIFDDGLVDILDFNNSSGQLSNSRVITTSKAWGVAFSPDGGLLYVSHWGGSAKGNIEQFDLSFELESDIQNSQITMGELTGPNTSYVGGYMMLAPDDKIYIAKYLSSYLGVIEFPNEAGIACDLNDNGFDLNGSVCQAGLPNRMHSKSGGSVNVDETEISSIELNIYPNPVLDYFTCELKKGSNINRLSVYDAIGNLVHSESFLQGEAVKQIDTRGWSNGIYTVLAIDTKQIVTKKVVVL